MPKSYVIVEKGLIENIVYHLRDHLTIGRSPDNDICISDPGVSKYHAVIYLHDHHAIIRDVNSLNGTFVHGVEVTEAVLNHEESFECGNVSLRFVQTNLHESGFDPAETYVITYSDNPSELDEHLRSNRSRRLVEAISRIPLFENLSTNILEKIAHLARLRVFDEDMIVVEEGMPGKSMFIVLDGEVQVLTRGKGKTLCRIAILKENQFFGEMSFLSGASRNATVQAMSSTLLCELEYETMAHLIREEPSIREKLVNYYEERKKDLTDKKTAAGIIERRKEIRFKARLKVKFLIPFPPKEFKKYKKTVFATITETISFGGMSLKINDWDLLRFPKGSLIRLKVFFPNDEEIIYCWAKIKNVYRSADNPSLGSFGLKIEKLSPKDSKKLRAYIQSGFRSVPERESVAGFPDRFMSYR